MTSTDVMLHHAVEAISLDQECERMVTKDGMLLEDAQEACELYRKFLFLNLKHGSGLTPSKLIDAAWHQHMADTKKYMDDCIMLCGTMIHHDPKIMGEQMWDQFDKTNALFYQEFGINMSSRGRAGIEVPEACGTASGKPEACGTVGSRAAACGTVSGKAAACGTIGAYVNAGVPAACGT